MDVWGYIPTNPFNLYIIVRFTHGFITFQHSNNLDQFILHSVISAWLDSLSASRFCFFLTTSRKDLPPYLDVERSPVQVEDVPLQCSICPRCGLVVSDLDFTRQIGLSLSPWTVLGGAGVPPDHVGLMPLSSLLALLPGNHTRRLVVGCAHCHS